MKTIKLPYKTTDSDFIETLMKEYSNVLRYSYNRFLDGKNQKDIRLLSKGLKNISHLNTWFIQCAIKDAEAIHKKNGNIKVIFGSRKHLYRRIKGLISNKEFKEYKISSITLQGESPKMGNRSFKLDIIRNNQIIFKVSKDKHIILDLPNIRSNYKNVLFYLETMNNIKQGINGLTYSIKLDMKFIYLTFEEPFKNKEDLNSDRYIGIDLNPNEIGISIKEGDKVLEVRRYIFNKNLNHNKVKHETYEISKSIFNLFKSYNCKFVFMEDLTIKSKDHGKSRENNKLINSWIRNGFISNLESKVNSIGGTLFKVNPAYSSFIGNIIYEFDDSINASLEIGRRGYEVIILKNKKFYPDINLSLLKDQWKEYFNDGISSWREFFILIKNLKLKYRVSLDNKVFSHISYKSGVTYYYYQL